MRNILSLTETIFVGFEISQLLNKEVCHGEMSRRNKAASELLVELGVLDSANRVSPFMSQVRVGVLSRQPPILNFRLLVYFSSYLPRALQSLRIFPLSGSVMISLRSNRICCHHLIKAQYLSLSVNDFSSKISIPFAKAKGGSFVQDAPHLENSFDGDAFLRRNLQRILPSELSRVQCNTCRLSP